MAKPKFEKSSYKGSLYHASPVLLNVGDYLQPSKPKDHVGPKWVHTAPMLQLAQDFGSRAAGRGKPFHVYEVEPEEDDTYLNNTGVPSRRHLKPVKIVKHVGTFGENSGGIKYT